MDNEIAPDYREVVKNPISLSIMQENLSMRAYNSVESFKSDVNLLFDNAMLYNAPDTVYFKTAQRLKRQVAPLLVEADKMSKAIARSERRGGSSADLGDDFEPVKGLSVSIDPWPGQTVREMSPMSDDISPNELARFEVQLENSRKRLQSAGGSNKKRKR